MTTVLVTGSTGTLGREVVARLMARHYHIRVLSHRSSTPALAELEVITGDLVSGSGLREAVAGVEAIIHCASAPQSPQQVDVEGTRSLAQAARATGTPHLIYPSIVGVGRSAYAYYQAKYAAEDLIEHGPLPWTIVRATQFHDLVLGLIRSFGADTLPVVSVVAGMRFQSIDVVEVADHLVSLTEHGPGGRLPDLAGPQVLTIEEMTEAYLRLRGRAAEIRALPPVGDTFQAFRSGINLVADGTTGTISWEAFLQRVLGREGASGSLNSDTV